MENGNLPRAAFGTSLHSLGDELFGDHNERRDDIAHGTGGGRDQHWGVIRESRQERLPELAGAEVDGGGSGRADDDGGDAGVEAEEAVGLEGLDDGVEGVAVDPGRALRLELCLDGVQWEEAHVREGAGEPTGCGADESALGDGEHRRGRARSEGQGGGGERERRPIGGSGGEVGEEVGEMKTLAALVLI